MLNVVSYAIVLIIFTLFGLQRIKHTKKIVRMMENEAKKSQIYLEMLQAEVEYKRLQSEGKLKDYPCISKSLKEISIIIERVGFNMNLDNIVVAPIKETEQMTSVLELVNERINAPEEIQNLIDKKAELVNRIAQIKHPINYYLNRMMANWQIKTIFFVVRAYLKIANNIQILKKQINYKTTNIGRNEIVNTYPILSREIDVTVC